MKVKKFIFIVTWILAMIVIGNIKCYKIGKRDGRQQLTDQIVDSCKSPNLITQTDLDSNNIIIVKFIPWTDE